MSIFWPNLKIFIFSCSRLEELLINGRRKGEPQMVFTNGWAPVVYNWLLINEGINAPAFGCTPLPPPLPPRRRTPVPSHPNPDLTPLPPNPASQPSVFGGGLPAMVCLPAHGHRFPRRRDPTPPPHERKPSQSAPPVALPPSCWLPWH